MLDRPSHLSVAPVAPLPLVPPTGIAQSWACHRPEKDLAALPYLHLSAAILCVSLPFAWQYEQPGKLHTVVAALTAYLLGTAVIATAKRAGIIRSTPAWLAAFQLKMLLAFLITQCFWAAPLSPDLIRTPYTFPGSQDANRYDYVAAEAVAPHSTTSWHRFSFTWQSFGVVAYLAGIYRLFGVSVLYVSLFNCVLSLAAAACLTGALGIMAGRHPKWQLLRFTMLLPHLAYYEATPSKEAIANLLFFASLYFISRLHLRVGKAWKNCAGLCLAGGSLGLVRPNLVLLFLAGNMFVILQRRLSLRLGLALAAMLLAAYPVFLIAVPEPGTALARILEPSGKIERTHALLAQRERGGDNPLKLAVGARLAPSGPTDLVLLAPVRAAIWFLAPYPFVVPDFPRLAGAGDLLASGTGEYLGLTSDLAALGSSWLLMAVSPYILAAILSRRVRANPGGSMLLLNFLTAALLISNSMFVMGRRYRVLVEPLAVAVALLGSRCQPSRVARWSIYTAFAVVGILCHVLF